MKRHQLATVFCVIFAALSLHKGFYTGEMERAIFIFIGMVTLGTIGWFYDRLRKWLRPIMLAIPVILLLFFAYQHLRDGEILQFSAVLGVLIVGGGLTLLQERGIIQEQVGRYTSFVPVIILALLLGWEIYSLMAGERPVARDKVNQAKPAIQPDMLKNRKRKMRDIIGSDDFITQMKEAAEAGIEPKPLQSLSSFRDYLVSQGMTEYADVDVSPSALEQHFQSVFQKHHPDTDPKDLDPEMRQRFIEVIEKHGEKRGRMAFLQTPEVAIWGTGRFNIFDQGGETISQWMDAVYIESFGEAGDIPTDADAVSVTLPRDTDFDSDTVAPIESEPVPTTHKPPDVQEPPDTAKWTVSAESKEVITKVSKEAPALPTEEELETTLSEQFSSERFERAMGTLERYGEEEGLRRLKEDDPEVAKQLERQRNREKLEESER